MYILAWNIGSWHAQHVAHLGFVESRWSPTSASAKITAVPMLIVGDLV